MADSLGVSLVRTTDATTEPVSIDEVKESLRVTDTHEDPLIERLITAARMKLEQDTRLALLSQTWTQAIDRFPCTHEGLPLFVGPLRSVTSVTSYSSEDVASTFSSGSYFVDTTPVPGRICLASGQTWPTGLRQKRAGVIVFVAGYGANDSDVPALLRTAICLLVGHWFEHRSAVTVGTSAVDTPEAYRAIVGQYAVHFIGDEAA